ncbi:MAG: bifunctional metallophosphatase/5'-nucleotidase [Oligoflexia bacterium]|nr:bifunctional metallophosphatase/5'-nucleotidase [Oligoflexia bacterium]
MPRRMMLSPPRLPAGLAPRRVPALLAALVAMVSVLLTSCDMLPVAVQTDAPALVGQDVRLTIIHTSDIHSRLLPYDFDPSFTDNGLGLADGMGSYGGIARIATIVNRERAKAGRVLHLDSGDCFQGAIIFNQYEGEAEVRLLSALGTNAAVIANHEFDLGAQNLANQYNAWGTYDLMAANYDFEDANLPWATGLETASLPSTIYDLDGLKVGVIGMANISSLNSIYDQSNSEGVRVLEPEDILPREISKLRTDNVDLVIVLSHMGLTEDQEMARTIPGIDLIMGGHNHVVTRPPLVVVNEETGQRVPIMHSGAFAKFVGRLDLVIRDGEILSFDSQVFPVDATVEEDPHIVDIIEEYEQGIEQSYNTDQIIGFACPPEENCDKLTRYGSTGGDSMLGNFTAEAMRSFPNVETEIALTNTLGIRADIPAGDITIDDIYNSMPFDNAIATMVLSGTEVQDLLDYVAYRSTERGCNAQAQVAGMSFDMICDPDDPHAENIVVNGVPLIMDSVYELATNDYIANGGSGFDVLERNTTKTFTGIAIRDVVIAEFVKYWSVPQSDADVCVEDGRINPIY